MTIDQDVLDTFATSCRQWYRRKRSSHNYIGRQKAYQKLTQKNGFDWMLDNVEIVRAELDKVEANVRTESE